MAVGFTEFTFDAKTSLSAWDTISPFVIITISAAFNIGPIFFGVLIPERLSITHTPFISLIYGEHLLQRPADSVISRSRSLSVPHFTTSSIFDTKKWSGQRAPDRPFLTGTPALSYRASSSVYRQSNFMPCCFKASIVFIITLVLPDEGGPENTTRFIIIPFS